MTRRVVMVVGFVCLIFGASLNAGAVKRYKKIEPIILAEEGIFGGEGFSTSATVKQKTVRSLVPTLSELVDIVDALDTKVESYFDMLSTSTAQLGTSVSSLSTSTASLGTSVTSLNTTVASLGTSTVSLSTSILSLNTSVTNLGSSLTDLNSTVAAHYIELVAGLDSAESVISALDIKVDSYNDALDARMLVQNDSVSTELAALNTAIGEVDAKITALNEQLASQDSSLLIDLVELNSAIEALDDKVNLRSASLSADIGELNALVAGVQESAQAHEKCCRENEQAVEFCVNAVSRHEIKMQDFESYTGLTETTLITQDQVLTADMLPGEGQTRIIRFAPVSRKQDNELDVLTIDPALFDDHGAIVLPKNSKLRFSGQGIVVLQDGVVFDMRGSSAVSDCVQVAAMMRTDQDFECAGDWPELIFENAVTVYVAPGATIRCGGQGSGRVRVRRGAKLLLDTPSHLILGEHDQAILDVIVDDNSGLVINHPEALLSFQYAAFNILFDRNSICDIMRGVCELNSNNNVYTPGNVRKIQFRGGSTLNVRREGDYAGCVAMAPNSDNSVVYFDNIGSFVNGGGDVRYRSFDEQAVDSTLQIQGSSGALVGSMGQLWMALAAHDTGAIAVRMGTLGNDGSDRVGQVVEGQVGSLAALCPERAFLPGGEQRSGRVVALQPGDSHLFYDVSILGGELDVISGVDARGNIFRIVCADVLR